MGPYKPNYTWGLGLRAQGFGFRATQHPLRGLRGLVRSTVAIGARWATKNHLEDLGAYKYS